MNIKNNKGVTMVDITISIMIIFLFSSLITGLIYNYSISTKVIQRRTEATHYAINIVEQLKQIDYDTIIDKCTNTNQQLDDEGNYYYMVSFDELFDELFDETYVKEGYLVTLKFKKYKDLMITATVTVTYKVGGNQNHNNHNVELTTLLVKEVNS